MKSIANPVWAFAVRVFLWLPVCFAVWYLIANWHARAVGWMGWGIVELYKSGIVHAIEFSHHAIAFVTNIKVHPQPGRTALLVPEVAPLVYTYGLALFFALALASKARWWKLLVGALALLPFQAWGIAFDLIAQVGIRMTPEIAAQAGLFGWRREFAALAYQLGSIIYPAVMPVLAWAALEHRTVAAWVKRTPPNVPPAPPSS